MAKIISDQMNKLSLESEEIIGKSIEAELRFCKSVKDMFVKRKFNQRIVFGYSYIKIYVMLFLCLKKG